MPEETGSASRAWGVAVAVLAVLLVVAPTAQALVAVPVGDAPASPGSAVGGPDPLDRGTDGRPATGLGVTQNGTDRPTNSTVGTASGPISVAVPVVTLVVLAVVFVFVRRRGGSDD